MYWTNSLPSSLFSTPFIFISNLLNISFKVLINY
jgi:hypothetical protein